MATGEPAETDSPSPTATPEETPTSLPVGWLGPVRISDRRYVEPSMVVDASGHLQVAARLGRDIWIVTNETGEWIREPLSSAPRGNKHTDPSIALDEGGSLWIAYSDRCDGCAPDFSEGVYYVTDEAGDWSTPRQIPGHVGERPLLLVRDSVVHIGDTDINAQGPVDDLDDIFRPVYVTGRDDQWNLAQVDRQGSSLAFALSGRGAPGVIHTGPVRRGDRGRSLFWSSAEPGTTDFQAQPVIEGESCYAVAAFGPDGNAAAIWSPAIPGDGYACDEAGDPVFTRSTDSGWTEPRPVVAQPTALAIDATGHAHALAVARHLGDVAEVIYFTDRSGDFETHLLGQYSDGGGGTQVALAIDAMDRAHIFVSTESDGTFYAVSPSP